MDFDTAQYWFRDNRIRELSQTNDGLRFLKLLSLSRREHLYQLFASAALTPQSNSARDLWKEAFNTASINDTIINSTIQQIYASEREARRKQEPELVNQLYRLDVFDWGGLHQNSLERTIIDNYVKKIHNYDQLSNSIENELHYSMRGYVLCSWYNHWTSIIIEDIFRDHDKVLPAVGLIKKIDFFINGIPFDLKVTYFPEGYIKQCRRSENKRPELTRLKQWARQHQVPFSTNIPDSQLLCDLWKKASDYPSEDAQSLLSELSNFRQKLIQEAKTNPDNLIKWLYENQGIRRFDASNRLFLVLIDPSDFFQSWKLKRAKPLLDSRITAYLDKISSSPGRTLHFTWEGKNYTVISEAIIITKPPG
ncbi:MAG: hypothetical protein RIM23_28560 [Coleofasciculus sp. G3-WIS-01]|uniref:hypothetical protein n=1 Tax=Coleofasciculus sp. G3-WIS-01 TaxID=3069528 RepID=UPI003300E2E7